MERPILFNTQMSAAANSGKKTNTRRTKKLEYVNEAPDDWVLNGCSVRKEDNNMWALFFRKQNDRYFGKAFRAKCPYGNIGDTLWVRETWLLAGIYGDDDIMGPLEYYYKANGPLGFDFIGEDGEVCAPKWKPNIHMPKVACRLKLEITGIRVERLRDISEEDSKKEGVLIGESIEKNSSLWYDYETDLFCFTNPKSSFKSLWRSINGEESWNNNPWVWVIEFKRL